MSALIKSLCNPLVLFLIGLFFAWLYRRRTNIRNALLFFSGLWLIIILFSPVPYYLTKNWKRKYPALEINGIYNNLNKKSFHIVVLGAGYENDLGISVTAKLSGTVALRLLEALRVYNMLDSAKTVTSGGAFGRAYSQAKAVADAAVALSVSPEDTLYLPYTLNTETEAASYFKRFGNKYPVILATDSMHMRRAMFWFEHFGIKAIPAPCNYRFKEDPNKNKPEFKWKPASRGIRMMQYLISEWLALNWAKLKTR